MPHLPPLATVVAPDAARLTLETLESKLGAVPNMYRTFAHAPAVLDASVAMAQAIRRDLDPQLRELAYLKVVQLTDCGVCAHYHRKIAASVGVTEAQVADIGRYTESGHYSALERDVIAFAEQWTLHGRVEDAALDRLKAALPGRDLVLLAATVSQANWTCRFNNVFGVELP